MLKQWKLIFKGQPYHTDDYIFNKNVKAVWGCPHTTSPLSRGQGDHKLIIHNQTKSMTWGRVGGGQKAGEVIHGWPQCVFFLVFMSGSCHLDRVLNVEIGIECQIFFIVIFFYCGHFLQFGVHSRVH